MADVTHRDLVPESNLDPTSDFTEPFTPWTFDPSSKKMDDGGRSNILLSRSLSDSDLNHYNFRQSMAGVYHAAGIFSHDEIDLFNNRYRFGVIDPTSSIGSVREYLFFTKPDLNIYPRDLKSGYPSTSMQEYLQGDPFWLDMASRYLPVLKCLQWSLNAHVRNPFNNLLGNMVQSNMEVPSLSAEMIETPNNMYGVGYTYRGSSEAGNDTYNFSLEFRDTKWKHVYNFFAAYEDYETLKHHGVLKPWDYYRWAKILYDQYAIYKFMVDEDGETILYAGKAFGVKSKSLPRDTFSNTDFNNGLSYSVDFEAAFYDDKPSILYQFNDIARPYYKTLPYQLDVHNHILDRPDNRAAKCAYVAGLPGDTDYPGYNPEDTAGRSASNAPGRRVFKLKWRGSDKE